MSVSTHFPMELERLKAHEAHGLVEFDRNGLRVTRKGRFFIRNLCMELDAYLPGQESKGPVFSRTV